MSTRLRKVLQFVLILGFFGFFISLYLTQTHYHGMTGQSGFCDINNIVSCSIVNTSIYSELFGIPVALLGAFWFVVLIYLTNKTAQRRSFLPLFFRWNLAGMLFVFYLIYAEYQLGTICPWCTAIHGIVLISFVSAVYLLRNESR